MLYLELNATNIYYRGKKAILVIFRDVTERKNFEEELLAAKGAAERSDQLKSEFLAQISHEIRTPINTILSYSSLLKEELIDKVPDDLKQSFSIIDEGSRRLIRTIDLILSMSQIQTGNFELNILEIDIFKNVLETLQLEFINQAKTKGIELNLISDTTDTKIPVDCFSVVQIFSNLIDNAIKFTKRGKVEIKIYQDIENRLCVDVQDTGVGISADFIPRLFTPFSQEEGGYTRSFEGNGLGLALVKKYAEFNNAKVSVTSDKGKGTTFTVAFKRMNIV